MTISLAGLDRLTRGYWRTTGRPVDLAGEHSWLRAPTSSGPVVGDAWLAEAAEVLGGSVRRDVADGGLLPSLSVLDGPGFRAADVRPEIRDFYEHTLALADGDVDGLEPTLPARG